MYLEKVIIAKQELDSLRPLDKGLEERVMQKLRLDWNYHSNSIEGNSLTYGETKSLILHHITAQGKPLRDHFEITGHNDALLWIIDLINGERTITENFIRELHTLILKENYFKEAITPDGQPSQKEIKVGEYKTQPNHVKTISGDLFYFAEPHEVKSKMTDLIDWYKAKAKEVSINPIILATEFHYKFILIHPFDDGNGRIARILMNFILMKFGYHPAIIKKENKEDYYKVLRLADGNNIEPFIEFISESVFESLTLMLNAIKGLPFEDENDIDKQFWLLDQKIMGAGKTINLLKSQDSIINFINNNLFPLKTELDLESQNFKKYYISIQSDFYIFDISKSLENEQSTGYYKTDLGPFHIPYDFHEIKLKCSFLDFNRTEIKSFNYVFEIFIYFEDRDVRITYKDTSITYLYDEKLNKSEVYNLFKIITKDHINFIELQLSNNQ